MDVGAAHGTLVTVSRRVDAERFSVDLRERNGFTGGFTGTYRAVPLQREPIMGGHSKWDQILLVKIAKYIVFVCNVGPI